ncbi:Putative zn(2)Cys(6) fungal-type DNA-binding domain-containing protein [Colletotrichum destructivum]|uniref:Zn(2)Cys(6) fungal-type DNA-binding domain-containing protein n=1 Tax=Colletotrichum destructivum TaxID=34406 RepID=A0AAX4IRU6_9PEZI|nr:Putative zn(2)Cys(6) fungal-type DNA-binding domain-containing protein [Colletotrichum destructivum]
MSDGGSPDIAHARKSRACTNCARLKIRCRWPPDSGHNEPTDCSRCSRMKLTCHVPEPAPRKRRGKSSRVTELEKKIDGLVNLFQTRQQSREAQGLHSTTTTPSSRDRNPMPYTGLTMPGLDRSSATQATPSGVSPDTTQNHNMPPGVDAGQTEKTFYLVPDFSLSVEKAEEYLNIYRTRMVPNFPFVPIPPSTTAAELHDKKRFLFWCIMQAVVPQTAAVQKAVDDWVRRHAAMHVIVLKDNSIELLQGLVVYVAWGEVHQQVGINANSLLQMAIGLVMDFTIQTLGGPLGWMPKTLQADAWVLVGRGKQSELTKHTLEEQRAILGGYFIASSVPAAMRRYSQIQFTPHLVRCSKAIREASELPSDQQLLALIRMQNVGDRIRAVFPSPDRDEGEPLPIFREHFNVVLSSIRKEILAIALEEPIVNKEQPMLWAHYQTLMVRLYEPCIGLRAASPSEAVSPTEPYSRTEALWHCLQAIQNSSAALLDLAAEVFAYLPFNLIADVAYSMMASHRLLLEDTTNDWDVSMARQKLDLPEITRRVGDKFEEADNVALVVGQKRRLFEDNSSRWSNYAHRARWIRQWYLTKAVPPPHESTTTTTTTNQSQLGSESTTFLNEANLSWLGGISMDQGFWEAMMLDGPGQIPFDASMVLPDQSMLPPMPSTS